jgi:Fe2+ or Zn2+ uptake regulation protein
MSKGNVPTTDAQPGQTASSWLARDTAAPCSVSIAVRARAKACDVYAETRAAGLALSPATVQRTLRCLEHLGLIRKLAVGGQSTSLTPTLDHHHILLEQDGTLIDVRHGTGIADVPIAQSTRQIS